jgi:hypothetical protein
VSGPAHGTLSGSGANRIYTPDPGYLGADSFSYVANDGTLDSAAATVSLNVHVNIAPVVTRVRPVGRARAGLRCVDLFSATTPTATSLVLLLGQQSDPTSGYFTVNGRCPGRRHHLRGRRGAAGADHLHGRRVHVGPSVRERLGRQPLRGPQEFHGNVPVNAPPTATAPDQSATRGQVFNASEPVLRQVTPTATACCTSSTTTARLRRAGHFEVNGVVQAAGTTFAVTAAQTGAATFTAGTYGSSAICS